MTTENDKSSDESAKIIQKDNDVLLSVPDGAEEPTRTQPKRKYGEQTITGIIVGQGDNKTIILYRLTMVALPCYQYLSVGRSLLTTVWITISVWLDLTCLLHCISCFL